MKITGVRVTPVAIQDPPLLNAVGIHQPYALRAIIEVDTDDGITGLGETYGDSGMLQDLQGVSEALVGMDPFHLGRIEASLRGCGTGSRTSVSLAPGTNARQANERLFAAIEVPCLDIQGKALGRPISDLLGGAVRDRVPFAAYLFFKHAKHADFDGYDLDPFGEVLTPETMVSEARSLVDSYGFQSLKLKGGVLAPDQEIETLEALRDAFEDLPIRIDPNAAWTVDTSIEVARRTTGVLEYLEDPTPGMEGMAHVARATDTPLATNMAVIGFADLPRATVMEACHIILADHHYWGGLRKSVELARICATWGLGLGMHSNSHLGISMAAMVHFGASVPDLPYAYDTHQPWQASDEVIAGGKLEIVGGSVSVPEGHGLGVELDLDAVARLHQQYLRCGIRERDDVAQMRLYDRGWTGDVPRF